jgi:hypothetical protein
MNDTRPDLRQRYASVMQKLTPTERLVVSQQYSADLIERTREAFERHFGDLGLQRWLEVFYDEKIARGVLGNKYQES